MKLTVIFVCDDYEYGAPRNDLADALEKFGQEMRLWTGDSNNKLIHKVYDTFEIFATFEEDD